MTPSMNVRLVRLLGWPGMISMALWVACLVFYFARVEPAQVRLEALRHESAWLLAQSSIGNPSWQGRVQTSEEQLAEFYRIFPGERDSAELIGRIAAILQRHGLSLEQGEYKVMPDTQGRLTRMQMILPLKGSYQQIRACLIDLTRELPYVALEQMLFERQKVGDPVLDAKFRLLAYLSRTTS